MGIDTAEKLLFFACVVMAYLKTDKKKEGTYLRIVESYRDGKGVSRKRTLHTLGRIEDYSSEMLQRIGARLYELGGGNLRALIGDDIEELGRYNYGFYQIYHKLYQSYGLDRILGQIAVRKQLSYDLSNAVFLMLLERLNEPGSKLCNWTNQHEYLGITAVDLHHLYRSLDHLADHQARIQGCIYRSGRDLFNQKLDVVFFDVTTFYFDSDKELAGELRQKGFSKDGKLGKTQILFGLLIDTDKQPIGYEIYSGDTFEGHSFEDALERLKKRYLIDKVILVADRGMLSKNNLAKTIEKGYHFIMGERLKQLPKTLQMQLLDTESYQHEWLMKEAAEEQIRIRYKEIRHQGRRIVATFSEKRAQKDAKDREKRLEKAEALLKDPSRLKAKARRHYISVENGKPSLDEEKIKQDQKYDGILAISTNEENLPVEKILDHYRNLYKIEHAFRSFKTHLETRPMFHWTDKRIRGHICLCYIAYALLAQLQLRLEKKKFPLSEKKIRKLIGKMQVSHIKNGNREFYIRSKLCDQTLSFLNRIGKRPIPNIIPKDLITRYL